MLTLPILSFLLNSLPASQVPAGTQIQIRLTGTVGSYASTAGTPLGAVLIAPVMVDGESILPAGTVVSGRVRRAIRVGLGIRHETASLDLEFNELTLPDGARQALEARGTEGDN